MMEKIERDLKCDLLYLREIIEGKGWHIIDGGKLLADDDYYFYMVNKPLTILNKYKDLTKEVHIGTDEELACKITDLKKILIQYYEEFRQQNNDSPEDEM